MKYFYSENKPLENAIDQFFMYIEKKNQELFSGEISIILLGSLSRGEATWINIKGRDVLLSDIEFFTVYPVGFSKFEVFNQVIHEAQEKYLSEIKTDLFHLDNSWISTTTLKTLERKLLTYDAQEMGITVVGKDMKYLLPKITLRNINLEDIYDILIHRVFSVLYYGSKVDQEKDFVEYRYLLAKNSLDLMTVLLVQKGRIASGFVRRYALLEKIETDEKLLSYFRYCLDVKFGQEVSVQYTISEMECIFIDLVEKSSKQFYIPAINRINNLRSVARRRMGMCKRALNRRHIPCSREQHLNNLIAVFKSKKTLSDRNLLDNWVLNGYPTPV